MLLNEKLTVQRNVVLTRVTILARDNDLLSTTLDASDSNLAINLGDDSRIGRVACLEELGHTWQTTGDVGSLVRSTVDLYDDLTWEHLFIVVDHDVGAQRQGIGSQHFLFLGIFVLAEDVNNWSNRAVLRLDNDSIFKASGGILLNLIGNAFDNVLVTDNTSMLVDDNGIEWVPFGDNIALLNLRSALKEECRTITDSSLLKGHTGIGILDTHFGHTANDNLLDASIELRGIDGTEFLDDEVTIIASLEVVDCNDATCDTTGVEGTEGKLGTRLTN